MSTVSVTNIKNAASASNNLVLDTSGNTTAAGTVAMGSSFLRNRIINGAMVIDQRNAGAAVTINAASRIYTVDRFFGYGQSADGVFTVQRDTSAPANFTNSAKITVTTADASVGATQLYVFSQSIEGFNTADFGWGTSSAIAVTLSFWVRSSVTGTFGGVIGDNGATRSYPFSYTINAANTWEYKTIAIPAITSGNWPTDNTASVQIFWDLGSGSTYQGPSGAWASAAYYGASSTTRLISTLNATWQITGVQLEVGTVATPFERRLYGTELALCQRYYEQIAGGVNFFSVSTTQVDGPITWKTTKRTTPTLSLVDTSIAVDAYGIGGTTSSASTIFGTAGISDTGATIRIDGFTGLTTSRMYGVNQNTSWIAGSSEL